MAAGHHPDPSAPGPGAADSERGEIYLRLMAEAELRRALAYPRYEPVQATAPVPIRAALNAASPLISRVRLGLPGDNWAAQTAVSAARQLASAAGPGIGWALAPVARHSAQAGRVLSRLVPSRSTRPQRPAMIGVERVRWVTEALVAAGTVSPAVAVSVLNSMRAALAVRGKVPEGYLRPGPADPPYPPTARPSGSIRAVAIAASVPFEQDGRAGELHLLTLVVGPDRAAVILAGRPVDPPRGPDQPARHHLRPEFVYELAVTDDRGTSYQVSSAVRGHGRTWQGMLDIAPVPPTSAGWLAVTLPGADPVRVNLEAADRPAAPPADPAPADCPPLPGALGSRTLHHPAERTLDLIAEDLLWHAAYQQPTGTSLRDGVAELVTALEAAGGLAAGSAALGRLTALAGRLGIPLPAARPGTAAERGQDNPGGAAAGQPAAMPPAWDSVLDGRGQADGPAGFAAAAAVLPPIGGARFALAGLESAAASFTVHGLAWGWQPGPFDLAGRHSWWACDDTGRWHLARATAGRFGDQVNLDLEFVPPLPPAARSVEIILLGQSGHAAITVLLDWQGAR